MEQIWNKIIHPDGILLYEGFTLNGKAFGAGTSFYPDGKPFHEGVFGIKGLILGREYYPNGQVRFEGVYHNGRDHYGPNCPDYGIWYSQDGTRLFEGRFEIQRSGIGYPTVKRPEGYGSPYYDLSWSVKDALRLVWFTWEDAKALGMKE